MVNMVFPVGIVSSTLAEMMLRVAAFWTSTTGAAPDTVSVSSTEPTSSCALTGAVKFVVNSIPARCTLLNPARDTVTL